MRLVRAYPSFRGTSVAIFGKAIPQETAR
jgi:hypothetical protein